MENNSNNLNQANMPMQNNIADDEIDLRELFAVIWQGKWLIIAITALFAVASVVYAISQPNIYKSEALLAPAEQEGGGGLSALAGQFGGLASLAGVNDKKTHQKIANCLSKLEKLMHPKAVRKAKRPLES